MEAILDFITQNWTFLLILVGSILVILTLYMLFNIRTSDTKSGEEEAPKKNPAKPVASEEPLPLLTQEPVVKNGEILPTLVIAPTDPAVEPEVTPVIPPVQPVEKPQAIEVSDKPTEEPIATTESQPKPKKPLGRYHVMFRAADEKWIVKRENADRIIRVLETQKEAISFATIKALTNETTIVIHKKDGKIRKQNYKKSDEA